LTSIHHHQPRFNPVQQTGRTHAGGAHRPDHEAAVEVQPKADGFRPSPELAESQTVKAAGRARPEDKKVQELKKGTERTRTQAARNRQGAPAKASAAKGGAANVQPPRQAEPASATKGVKQTGMGQTQMGERKFPKPVDRGTYINNLKATFGEG